MLALALAGGVPAHAGAPAKDAKSEIHFSPPDRPTPRVKPGPNYIQFEQFTIPVIRREALEGHIVILVFLELVDPERRERVLDARPPLRDAYYRSLYRFVTRDREVLENLDLPQVKAMLLRETERVMGPGLVREVLVQAAVQRLF